jgi:NitT/TauT family transport system substrate-binding protein
LAALTTSNDIRHASASCSDLSRLFWLCALRFLPPALALLMVLVISGCGNRPAKTSFVRIATYTQGSLTALPLLLTEQLGYFKSEGLVVNIEETASGAKAIQALLGGSADVASAFYELTVQMAAQGRGLTSFVSLARYPGYVLVASPVSPKKVRRAEDLSGAMVAISSPGSPTDQFLKYVLARHSISTDAASTVSAGSNAARLAMLERGSVDAAVLSDPVFTQFSRRHPNVPILADVRNSEGVKQVFGTNTYTSAVLTSQAQWLEGNPGTARRLARAVNRTLTWISNHSPEEIAKVTPERLRGGDPALFLDAVRASLPSFPQNARFESEGMEAVIKVLAVANPHVKLAGADLAKTYTNEFATEK